MLWAKLAGAQACRGVLLGLFDAGRPRAMVLLMMVMRGRMMVSSSRGDGAHAWMFLFLCHLDALVRASSGEP